jgi:hypothetical protein
VKNGPKAARNEEESTLFFKGNQQQNEIPKQKQVEGITKIK